MRHISNGCVPIHRWLMTNKEPCKHWAERYGVRLQVFQATAA
jgi:hypothetical protein